MPAMPWRPARYCPPVSSRSRPRPASIGSLALLANAVCKMEIRLSPTNVSRFWVTGDI